MTLLTFMIKSLAKQESKACKALLPIANTVLFVAVKALHCMAMIRGITLLYRVATMMATFEHSCDFALMQVI